MLNVEKVIRLLGVIAYTILWLPLIIFMWTVMPIGVLLFAIKSGEWITDTLRAYFRELVRGIVHDVEYVQTGKW